MAYDRATRARIPPIVVRPPTRRSSRRLKERGIGTIIH